MNFNMELSILKLQTYRYDVATLPNKVIFHTCGLFHINEIMAQKLLSSLYSLGFVFQFSMFHSFARFVTYQLKTKLRVTSLIAGFLPKSRSDALAVVVFCKE